MSKKWSAKKSTKRLHRRFQLQLNLLTTTFCLFSGLLFSGCVFPVVTSDGKIKVGRWSILANLVSPNWALLNKKAKHVKTWYHICFTSIETLTRKSDQLNVKLNRSTANFVFSDYNTRSFKLIFLHWAFTCPLIFCSNLARTAGSIIWQTSSEREANMKNRERERERENLLSYWTLVVLFNYQRLSFFQLCISVHVLAAWSAMQRHSHVFYFGVFSRHFLFCCLSLSSSQFCTALLQKRLSFSSSLLLATATLGNLSVCFLFVHFSPLPTTY